MDSKEITSEMRRCFSFSNLIKNVFFIQILLTIIGGVVLFPYSTPVALADCMFDGSCNGNSGNSIPLGPGTPGYQNLQSTPTCVENCGTSPAPNTPSRNVYSRPVPSAPTLTPMQAYGAAAIGGAIGSALGDAIGNALFGNSAEDKAKALREQQLEELQKQQEFQREQAAKAAAEAKAAEERRLKKQAFLNGKKKLEQSLCSTQQKVEGKASPSTTHFPQINAQTTEEFWKGTPDEPDTSAPCPPSDGWPHLTPNHFWDGVENSLNQNTNDNSGVGSPKISSSTVNPTNTSATPTNHTNNATHPGQMVSPPDQQPSNAVTINGTTPMNLHQDDPGGYKAMSESHVNKIQVPSPQPSQKSWYDKMNDELNQQLPNPEPFQGGGTRG